MTEYLLPTFYTYKTAQSPQEASVVVIDSGPGSLLLGKATLYRSMALMCIECIPYEPPSRNKHHHGNNDKVTTMNRLPENCFDWVFGFVGVVFLLCGEVRLGYSRLLTAVSCLGMNVCYIVLVFVVWVG